MHSPTDRRDVTDHPDGRAGITVALVRRLVAEQTPQWAHLPVRPVPADGWDNRTYRLGDDLTVRLPTAAHYVAAVAKEDRWLPFLAPRLPVPVPEPVFTGRPGAGYPFPWSVRRWLPGATVDAAGGGSCACVPDPVRFAAQLGEFLVALWSVDPTGGPEAGEHSFFRGAPPSHYDDETRSRLHALGDGQDRRRGTDVWDAAVAPSPDAERARWFHGDVSTGNLLVRRGSLAAVLDFGTCGVGDPACDLVPAWTFLAGAARRRFADVVGQDGPTWARARGWALWKALISIGPDDAAARAHRRVVREVLDDPVIT